MHTTDAMNSEEMNLVEIWLRKDIVRWISGAISGAIAGIVALVAAMALSAANGLELWFPAKVAGSIVLGATATETGFSAAIIVGAIIVAAVGTLLGAIYAHFTATNQRGPLLAMGFVWGTFSWIFIWCLFIQSFQPVLWTEIPKSAAFLIMQIFGASLSIVANIDPIIRGKKH